LPEGAKAADKKLSAKHRDQFVTLLKAQTGAVLTIDQ
jgi:hypothetical protein